MSGLTRQGSSRADKPKTAWDFVVLKVKSGFEVQIMWKSTRNKLSLYNIKKKGPFGRIKSAKIVTEENDRGEVNIYYQFVNDLCDTGKFKSSLMNPLMVGINPFSKKVAELRNAGK